MQTTTLRYAVLDTVRLFTAGTPIGVPAKRVATALRVPVHKASQVLFILKELGFLRKEGTRGWRLSEKGYAELDA